MGVPFDTWPLTSFAGDEVKDRPKEHNTEYRTRHPARSRCCKYFLNKRAPRKSFHNFLFLERVSVELEQLNLSRYFPYRNTRRYVNNVTTVDNSFLCNMALFPLTLCIPTFPSRTA